MIDFGCVVELVCAIVKKRSWFGGTCGICDIVLRRMGGGNSRDRSLPESSSVRSSSSSYPDQYKYPPQTAYPARNEQQRTLGGKYSCIADNYNSLEEVRTHAIAMDCVTFTLNLHVF